MAEHDGAQHNVFRQFIGLRFHHQYGVFRTGHDEVERCLFHLVERRVQHIFAVNIADAGRADGALERQAGNRQRRRNGCHGNHIGIVFKIMAHNRGDDLRFVFKTFDKKRTNGTVDQTRDQSLFF